MAKTKKSRAQLNAAEGLAQEVAFLTKEQAAELVSVLDEGTAWALLRLLNDRANAEAKAHPEFCCPECGGTSVQCSAWIDANTNEVINSGCDGPCDSYWCEDCQDHQARLASTEVQP